MLNTIEVLGGKCKIHVDIYNKIQKGKPLSAQEHEDWNFVNRMKLNAISPLSYMFDDTVCMEDFHKMADWCATQEDAYAYRNTNKRDKTLLCEGTVANHSRAVINLTNWLIGEYYLDEPIVRELNKVLNRLRGLVNNYHKSQKDKNIIEKIISLFDVQMSKEEVYRFIQPDWLYEQREKLIFPDWSTRDWTKEELYHASAYIACLLISKTAKQQKVVANVQWCHLLKARPSEEFHKIWMIVVEDPRIHLKTKKASVLGVIHENIIMMQWCTLVNRRLGVPAAHREFVIPCYNNNNRAGYSKYRLAHKASLGQSRF